MFFETNPGLLCCELANYFHSVKEVVKSHRAIRLKLGLSKCFALLYYFFDDLFGRLCARKLSLFLRLLLRDDNLSERNDLLVVIQIVVFAASDQI